MRRRERLSGRSRFASVILFSKIKKILIWENRVRMMAIRFTAQHSTSIEESACTRKNFQQRQKKCQLSNQILLKKCQSGSIISLENAQTGHGGTDDAEKEN